MSSLNEHFYYQPFSKKGITCFCGLQEVAHQPAHGLVFSDELMTFSVLEFFITLLVWLDVIAIKFSSDGHGPERINHYDFNSYIYLMGRQKIWHSVFPDVSLLVLSVSWQILVC